MERSLRTEGRAPRHPLVAARHLGSDWARAERARRLGVEMASKSSAPADTTRRPSSRSTTASHTHGRNARADPPGAARKTYVLDTSVLLSDPRAMLRFAEHEVVLPVVVVTELEGKRHHPELGYFARQALRLLDDLRISEGRLDRPVAVGDVGGSLRVELNHTDPSALPAGFRLGDNDTRILSVAKNLANEGCDVTIVSKDLPMRVKASACGLQAEEYRHEQGVDSGWTGIQELDLRTDELDLLYERGRIEHDRCGRAALPHRSGPALAAGKRSGAGGCRQADPARAR